MEVLRIGLCDDGLLQSFKEYLRQALVFMVGEALREEFAVSVFQEIFASAGQVFIAGGGLGARQ